METLLIILAITIVQGVYYAIRYNKAQLPIIAKMKELNHLQQKLESERLENRRYKAKLQTERKEVEQLDTAFRQKSIEVMEVQIQMIYNTIQDKEKAGYNYDEEIATYLQIQEAIKKIKSKA